jgi:ribose transport system substrate-binding protein
MQSRLHWKVTTFDGKSQPSVYTAGIRQALVARASGIVLVGIDCASVKPALHSANAAGVPVVSLAGFDCSEPSQGGGPSLMHTADLGGSPGALFGAQGSAMADYVAAETSGQANAIVATEPDLQAVVTELAAFKSELTRICPKCQIAAEAPALIADLVSGGAAPKLSQVLLKHPDANVMVALQDSQLPYVTNAMRTSAKRLPILPTGGLPSDVQLVKNGTVKGVMAFDAGLQIWVIADFMVRLLAHEQPVVVPAVFTLMDAARNLPVSGGFKAPVDYVSAFSKSWQ